VQKAAIQSERDRPHDAAMSSSAKLQSSYSGMVQLYLAMRWMRVPLALASVKKVARSALSGVSKCCFIDRHAASPPRDCPVTMTRVRDGGGEVVVGGSGVAAGTAAAAAAAAASATSAASAAAAWTPTPTKTSPGGTAAASVAVAAATAASTVAAPPPASGRRSCRIPCVARGAKCRLPTRDAVAAAARQASRVTCKVVEKVAMPASTVQCDS